MKSSNLIALSIAALVATPALADINVGVIASLTGPAAALGAETKKAVALFPTTVGGEKINFIVLDDGTDPTNAVKNVRKLISEDKVDAILGPNLISTAVAMADVANAEKTPMISVAPLDVSGDKRGYIFRSEPSADLMVNRVVADMVEGGAKTVGFIGFSDSWGELLLKALTKATEGKMSIVATERYGRADPSVQAQVLKVLSAKPDVVFVGASGTPAAMPQITLRERGYKGKIYQSHGVTSKEFLRVGGKFVEGALIPVGPVLVAEQLPDSHPTKKNGVAFVKEFEAKNGPDSRSTFAGASWDAWQLLQNAIVTAQKAKVKSGTPEFRNALRDGIEKTSKLVGTNGVYTMGANDHAGYDASAIVLIKVENNHWKLVK
ncbi:ABC transporter substrate-binding protein [Zoogloea sp.]|jgi:branched-chain amino acid transport system substrate-binding protein|uniref:ABC transporter substrate-binding protein n=1 Tax=Zoogloea sp. TaxID=49181 RepID=UPI001B657AF2|nr:ABC transporter substrate-binding protein [Zoogloea sp.]MBK6656536.1 ABC transporter substrate-binding protein [Zoogloea sp.]MBP7446733.1 ABC transporter substrate-binding protein [Zoogloea sp.]HOY02501.1 ABC transporter substrate-binding protein [Zoogloea sp.]